MYVITGWTAGKMYQETSANLEGAQICVLDAIERGFITVRVVGPDGHQMTPDDVEAAVGSDLPFDHDPR